MTIQRVDLLLAEDNPSDAELILERGVARGYELGATSYGQKPVDFDRLRETVRVLGLNWLSTNEPPPASLQRGEDA